MSITNDDHEAARIIKDLEDRVSDLEETSRETVTPNLLITVDDTATVDDAVSEVRSPSVESLLWNSDATGWNTSSWGQYD